MIHDLPQYLALESVTIGIQISIVTGDRRYGHRSPLHGTAAVNLAAIPPPLLVNVLSGWPRNDAMTNNTLRDKPFALAATRTKVGSTELTSLVEGASSIGR